MQSLNPEFPKMVIHAEKALVTVLDVKANEEATVITDKESENVALAFAEACRRLGLSTELINLGDRKKKGYFRDVPQKLMEDMNHPDIYINTFKSYPQETPFRLKLLEIEMDRGARIAHAPGIDESMLLEGALTANFEKMWEKAERLMNTMEGASEVHITTPAGTDLLLKVEGRKFQTDLRIGEKEMGNLPAGEIWCAPLEDGADGVAVIDGTIGDFGFPPCMVKIHMSGGKVVSLECDDEKFREELDDVLHADEMAHIIGELGIGLNEGAKLVGNMLVDEKAAGTVHIAFGNNIDFYGGVNNSSMHRDFLMHKPDMVVTYSDGSVRKVMEKGKLLMD